MPDDPPKKRPGTMSDDDRALGGHRDRFLERVREATPNPNAAPEHVDDEDSLPVITDARDGDVTPVEIPPSAGKRRRKRQSIQEFATDIKGEVRDLRRTIADLHRAIDESIRAELNNRALLAERLVKVETQLSYLDDLDDETAAGELLKLRADLTSLRVTLIGEKGDNGKIGVLTEKAEKGPRFIKRAIVMATTGILGAVIPAALFMRGMVADSAAERATFHAELEAGKAERSVLQSQVLLLFRLVGGRAGHGGIDPSLAPVGDRP